MAEVVRLALLMSCVTACGRIAFDPLSDASRDGASGADSTTATVTYGKVIAERHTLNGSTDMFAILPGQIGDVVLVHVACEVASGTPTGYTASAPGWTFTQLTSLANVSGVYATTLVAFVPTTAQTTVTTSWQGGVTCTSYSINADEFANVDPSAALVFDAFTEVAGSGDCTATLTTAHDHDAIWAGCASTGSSLSGGPGYTMSTDDGFGDVTEYKLTTDPAGTVETATLINGPLKMFVMGMVAIKPR